MRHAHDLRCAACTVGAVFAALASLALTLPAVAQSQLPRPAQLPPAGGGQSQAQPQPPQAPPQTQQQPPQAQQAAPPKPYQPVAVQPPQPNTDPTFEAFRKQLAAVATKKDRAGLAKLVVTNGFFWEGETGDRVNKRRSSIDNLAAAIGLNDKEGTGWQLLGAAAMEPTLEPIEGSKGVMCAPGRPKFDEQGFEALLKATDTDAEEWGFPTKDKIEVRGAAQPNAPIIETLGLYLVRVLGDDPSAPAPDPNQPPPMIRVVGPSGKVGFVPYDALLPVTFDQICYLKDASGWKITGYAGGA